MGYRSEVAYTIAFKDDEKRNEFIALMKVRGDDLWDAVKELSIDAKYPNLNFYASDVKWYESYPDVDMHHKLHSWIEEHYEEYAGYKFLRVGEEQGDIDEREGGDSNLTCDIELYPYQGMEIPFDTNADTIGVTEVLTPVNKEEVHA